MISGISPSDFIKQNCQESNKARETFNAFVKHGANYLNANELRNSPRNLNDQDVMALYKLIVEQNKGDGLKP
jgi:hypothetical protein